MIYGADSKNLKEFFQKIVDDIIELENKKGDKELILICNAVISDKNNNFIKGTMQNIAIGSYYMTADEKREKFEEFSNEEVVALAEKANCKMCEKDVNH